MKQSRQDYSPYLVYIPTTALTLRGLLPFWRVMLIGVALSVLGASALYQWEYRLAYAKQQANYNQAARERIQALQDKLSHALEQVKNLAAFYNASEEVSRREFHLFAQHLLAHEPSLQALEWVPRVAHNQRAEYEQAAQRYFPDFRITEWGGPHDSLQSAAYREAYFPVHFVEPYQGNEAVLGLDIHSEPIRRAALNQAIASGQPVASGRVSLVQETGDPYGFLVFVPVFHAPNPLATEAQHRQLHGLIVGVVRIATLVKDALAHLEPKGIDLWFYDQSVPAERQFLYGYLSPGTGPMDVSRQPPEAGLLHCEFIEIAGRRWLIVTTPAPGQFQPSVSATPLAVLVSGLIITGLLIVYLNSLQTHAARLAHQAHHDSLTGLPNRYLLQDRLQHTLHQAERHQGTVAVLLVDLDNFKDINDSLGHQAGDHLLQSIAKRLSACIRESDTVARLGGDEFMLVLAITDDQEGEHVSAAVQRVLSSVSQPLQLESQEVVASCSIGVSLYPRDGSEVQTLLRNADAAMYRAKAQGGNAFRFYQAEMNARALEQLNLQNSLRRALERGELRLLYQPQIELGSARIIGMEALIRWEHPEQGLMAPARFIPLAEETGLIVPIGEWVLRTACAQARAWQTAGLPAVNVAVNLSARQFQRGDLAQTVAQVLAETELEARYLELELTETLLMKESEEITTTLDTLKAMGVRFSIDDFGTGYSSLSYLKRFPVDRIKIDRSFVRDITTSPDAAAIIRAVIAIAQILKLKVIAEGVETEAQLAFLKDHNCTEMQGYYFSRPLPAEEAAALFGRVSTTHP